MTAILKELRETIRVTNFKYIQFKKLYTHEMIDIHMGPAQRRTVLELMSLLNLDHYQHIEPSEQLFPNRRNLN